ncbi:MAG: aminoacyl-histidine dipeptidase [Oscillospiraceae bacterium]|nr:aminoacyl-histidine dipeptidase [Oscillospiraceae bacterium]
MENRILAAVEPKKVMFFFEQLCALPHGSGNTKAASDWAVEFAKERNLRYRQDELGNVVIWKGATPGYEDHPTVMLQGHLDMVCVHDNDVEHDFTKDGLKLCVEDGYIKATGTTLGADNGIAIAMGMAVLDDDTMPHPPLEVLMTVDEEVGMLGAVGLDGSDLKSKYLINIDSDVEGYLTVGCAGGARSRITMPVAASAAEGAVCTVKLEGLSGGHSGIAINKGFGNANKLMADCLNTLGELRLVSVEGGTADNAIPSTASAVIVVEADKVERVKAAAETWAGYAKASCPNDPGFTFTFESNVGTANALSVEESKKAVDLLLAVPSGVQSMNPAMPDQVQTSLNLGMVSMQDGALRLTFSLRSGLAAEKDALAAKLHGISDDFGAKYEQSGDYPAWEYRAESVLRDTMVRIYKEQYGKEPVVETIHAGLECGVLMSKVPGLDAVSMGPTLLEIHSTRERAEIASVERTWKYLTAVLAAL